MNVRRYRAKVILAFSMLVLMVMTGCQDRGGRADKKSTVQLYKAESVEDFEQNLNNYYRNLEEGDDNLFTPNEQQDMNATDNDGMQTSTSETTANGTNLVEQGVDEGDFVKSDGEYLYIAQQTTYSNIATDDGLIEPLSETPTTQKNARVRILRMNSNPANAEPVSEISLQESGSYLLGIYIHKQATDTSLLILSNRYDGESHQYRTSVHSYDVSSAEEPHLNWRYELDSSYISSRILHGRLYLVNNRTLPPYDPIKILPHEESIGVEVEPSIDIKAEDVLPQTWLNGVATADVKATDCLIPSGENSAYRHGYSLMTILAIPLNDPEDVQSLCTMDSGYQTYVSSEAIYTTRQAYDDHSGTEQTVIHKFALSEEGVAYRASGQVAGTSGWRSSAFRMNEHNGMLRIVLSENAWDGVVTATDMMTVEQGSESSAAVDTGGLTGSGNTGYDEDGVLVEEPVSEPDVTLPNVEEPDGVVVDDIFIEPNTIINRLYILAEDDAQPGKLVQVGQLPNEHRADSIGKEGESIYAVRFQDNYAYVVTFRRTDPFYVLNLSNPHDPFIEGELAMPGYSDYLHPFGENLLLGVGMDAGEVEGWVQTAGIKVGLFDVSNKSQPQLINEYIIGDQGSSTALSYDHHAFSILSDEQSTQHRLAIPADIYQREASDGITRWSYSGLQLFELNEGSGSSQPWLHHSGTLKSHDSATQTHHYSIQPRSVLRGDEVFYVDNGSIWAADWQQPEAVSFTE